MADRTCVDCGRDISGLHGNAKRCPGCRATLRPPSKRSCGNGCDAPVVAHDMCARCYVADVRKHGPYARLSAEDRFWLKVDKNGPTPEGKPELGPCWMWTGATHSGGYGNIFIDGHWVRAHHFAYELLAEPIPDGLRLRNVCGMRACVKPGHWELAMSVDDQARIRRDILAPVPLEGSAGDLGYWGALLDGEGHLGIRKNKDRPDRPTGASRYIARVSVGMTDEQLVREFAARFRISAIVRHSATSRSERPMYYAEANGSGAARIMMEMLPHLRLKRRQAELIIMLEREKCQPGLRTRYTGTHVYRRANGTTVTRKKYATAQEHLDRWDGYFREVKSLNRQGRDA